MRIPKIAVSLLCFTGVFLLLHQSEIMNAYVNLLKKSDSLPVFHTMSPDELSNEELLQQIQRKAEEHREEPVNAKLDRVWKAIPGYNGREVDVDTTYRFALKFGMNYPIFYKEIPPEVSLQDLGPSPIYKGNPNKPMASIMVNVAWGNEYIPKILDTLRGENVKATFFFDGSWLSENKELAMKIAEDGHELSNHGYSHKDMSTLDREAAYAEINKTQKLLKEVLSVDNQLFAPPSGDYDMETVKLAHELGLKTVLWTLDTVDWKEPDPAWIVNRIQTRIEPGALILMHPTNASSSALPDIIEVIKRKGLKLGTVSELLSPKRVTSIESPHEFW